MDKSESSSPLKEVVSPLGVSRYGRTRKPKISADFCHIDDILKHDNSLVTKKSPTKSPKQNDVSPTKITKTSPEKKIKPTIKPEIKEEPDINIVQQPEVSAEIENEGLKVLNEVFESAPIDDVLKIIGSTKVVDENLVKKRSPQQVRTYVNKRKVVAPQSRVIESFGLPDDPIVPMYGEKLIFKQYKDLDIDETSPENVTLVDDLIENVIKVNCDDVDNKNATLEIGNITKDKENHSFFKNSSKRISKTYNSLKNGLLDKKYKQVGESNKKFKTGFEKSGTDESIKEIIDSFTELERKPITNENLHNDFNLKHENNTNIAIVTQEIDPVDSNHDNTLRDHIYVNNPKQLEEIKIQETNENMLKIEELVCENTEETNQQCVIIGNDLATNSIHKNEMAIKIKEKYDNINRNSSVKRKRSEGKIDTTDVNNDDTSNNIIQNNSDIQEAVDVKPEINGNKTKKTKIQPKIDKIDITPNKSDDIQKDTHELDIIQNSSVIQEAVEVKSEINDNKTKETKINIIPNNSNDIQEDIQEPQQNIQKANSIDPNSNEIIGEVEEKQIISNTKRTIKKVRPRQSLKVKKNLEVAETFDVNNSLQLTENDVKVTENDEEVKQEIKSEDDFLIRCAYLEDFENCSFEDDSIPLKKLRGNKASGSVNKKIELKKRSVKTKQNKEIVNGREDSVKNKKSLKTRQSREKLEISPKKEVAEEKLDESSEKGKTNARKLVEQKKSAVTKKVVDQKVSPGKSPVIKKKSKKDGDFKVSLGQLLWAQVGNFPYWPCMVAEEPESKNFIKFDKKLELCHVRFFGDRGRRAWIRKRQLHPYCSFGELQKDKTAMKSFVKCPTKNVHYRINWNKAIDEANSLENKELEEKFAFFENVLRQQDKAKKEKPLKTELENSKSHSSPKQKKNNQEESESESETDISLQGFPSNMKEQITLYKRNNLFKKVTKERVCQICLKLGAVLRCKGRCQGFYHVECAEKNHVGKSVNGVKDEKNLKIDKIDDLINNEIIVATHETQVEIIAIKDRKRLTPTNLVLNNDAEFKNLPLFEQIDHKMTEVMKDLRDRSLYLESSTDCSLQDSSVENSPDKGSTVTKPEEISGTSDKKGAIELFCKNCSENNDPVCFICHKEISKTNSEIRQRCSWFKCGRFYHPECLKVWPQTQWSVTSSTKKYKPHSHSNEFICPMHVCHTCVSDDPRSSISRCYSDKLIRCIYCPSTYHAATHCVPAGSQILSTTQIICPIHENYKRKKRARPINTTWCFICSEGGTLVCCETCPTSVHADCLDIKYTEDDKFICEDCETGRFPLYDEIVWVKLGNYRWWPAIILFPNEIPEKVKNRSHYSGEFVVKFFGTYDHYWISKGRVFLFQEGDNGGAGGTTKRKMEEIFRRSIEEAMMVHLLKKEFKESILREAEGKSKNRPPPYVRIKVNRPVGNVRQFDGNISNTTPCECDPKQKNPCGPDSDCLNRLLMTECDPAVCPAGINCQNQNFEQRKYPDLVPYKTDGRGWGLQSLQPLKKGQFVIEYVGEMIDEREYQRRIKQMHELKEENYYFLTIDKDRMIDAGPKGNLARFMNHSCQPNCETQKWTVNGDTRVGLFTVEDIPANTELTFNYNLECIGKEKKICRCGALNCSGFIGLKVKQVTDMKTKVKSKKYKKKRSPTPIVQELVDPCFICGLEGDLRPCDNKICSNYYHLKCVGLENWPEGKWICPWHNCTVCMKRTIRCCVKCLNSYCPKHSQGNVRYDKLLGFICSTHDPRKKNPSILEIKTDEAEVTSTTVDLPEEIHLPLVDPLDISSEVGVLITSTPYKTDLVQSKTVRKRKRSGKSLDLKPASKRSKYDRASLQKNTSSDSSRTLRSATVNSNSDSTKLKVKA